MPRLARRHRKTAEETTPDSEPPVPAAPPGPPLIVLVPRSGVTSFAVNVLPDNKSGRALLQSILQTETGLPKGLIAFWALQDPPPEFQDDVEPVVLIRNPKQPSIACPYFFVDRLSSQAYAATKWQQGTDPAAISIYLALIVAVHVDQQGAISLVPAHPPYIRKTQTSGHVVPEYVLAPRPEELSAAAGLRHKLRRALRGSPPGA